MYGSAECNTKSAENMHLSRSCLVFSETQRPTCNMLAHCWCERTPQTVDDPWLWLWWKDLLSFTTFVLQFALQSAHSSSFSRSYASIRGCLTNLSSSRVFLNPRYVKALASSKASHAVLPLSTSQENDTLCSDLCLPLLPHPPSVSLTVCGHCTPTHVCFPRWPHPVVMPCSHD